MSRTVHLTGAALLGTYVYAPAPVADPLRIWLQVLVIPAVTLTGLFLWKQAQLRLLTRRLIQGTTSNSPKGL